MPGAETWREHHLCADSLSSNWTSLVVLPVGGPARLIVGMQTPINTHSSPSIAAWFHRTLTTLLRQIAPTQLVPGSFKSVKDCNHVCLIIICQNGNQQDINIYVFEYLSFEYAGYAALNGTISICNLEQCQKLTPADCQMQVNFLLTEQTTTEIAACRTTATSNSFWRSSNSVSNHTCSGPDPLVVP